MSVLPKLIDVTQFLLKSQKDFGRCKVFLKFIWKGQVTRRVKKIFKEEKSRNNQST